MRDDSGPTRAAKGEGGRSIGIAEAGASMVRDATEKVRDYPFTIGDLSKNFGTTLRTLRFYEEKGLLEPERDGQTRRYSRRDKARLSLILMGKRLGFSLNEIANVLALYDLPDGQRKQLVVTRDRLTEQLYMLEEQKKDLETATRELRALAVEIDRRLEANI